MLTPDPDQVVNFEVVLADGTIINANKDSHTDLYRALKGGGNNFGIVTRFDVVTFPAHDIWDGSVVYTKSATPDLIKAFVNFTASLTENPDAHILFMWTLLPGTKAPFVNMLMTHLDWVENGKSLQKFMDIPGEKNMTNTSIAKKIAGFLLPSGQQ